MNNMVHKTLRVSLLASLPLLAGCAWLEPSMKLPKLHAPDHYTTSTSNTMPFMAPSEAGSWEVAKARVAEPRGNWWEMYNDSQLNSLMQDALANSPDLQIMAARVKQARAQAGIAESDLYPTIYADGGVTRQKLAPSDLQQPDTAHFKPLTSYNVGLGASYEIDLFGQLAGTARQARFQSIAQKDLYESTKLSLQADVAQAYFAARASAAELADVSETLSLGERNLALTKRQYELGDISSQTYQQTLADLMSLRNNALSLQQQQVAAQNSIATLLGKMPGSVVISDTSPLTGLPPMIPADVPASLLERRPDVAAAENQLAAANASIGVARAAFFPSISLTGTAGYAARDVGNLFKSNTSTWSVGPAITLPIFQGATNINNLRLSWGVYEEGVATYKQQVLAAFSDVDNALTAHRVSLEQASGQQQAVEQLNKTAAMAEQQYAVGDISQQDLIAAKQQALSARITGQQALYTAYDASAQLMRALGGSWETTPAPKR